MRKIIMSLLIIVGGLSLMGLTNGFDLTKHNIPVEEIQSGGPPKDGIPALLEPKFVPAKKAKFMNDDDRVLAIDEGGEAKAYPIRILNWHEVVNDEINGTPVMISYCPLCGTGMAFDPVINGRKHTFGVSGLLYNSNVLLYDHQTESLWSQIKQEAVAGELTGTPIKLIFLVHTTWGQWLKDHPNTQVLSTDTGYSRDYDRDPYAGYASSARLMVGLKDKSDQFDPKEWVLGITVGKTSKAYAFSDLAKQPERFMDTVNGREIQIHYNDKTKTAFISDPKGIPIPSVTAFWFAWYAFHPETELYSP